jgi:hypothetical protein
MASLINWTKTSRSWFESPRIRRGSFAQSIFTSDWFAFHWDCDSFVAVHSKVFKSTGAMVDGLGRAKLSKLDTSDFVRRACCPILLARWLCSALSGWVSSRRSEYPSIAVMGLFSS